jgi:hypothetical protein
MDQLHAFSFISGEDRRIAGDLPLSINPLSMGKGGIPNVYRRVIDGRIPINIAIILHASRKNLQISKNN